MRFVACPGVVGAQGVEEAVFCFFGGMWLVCWMLAAWEAEKIRGEEGKTHLEPSWTGIYHQTTIHKVKAEPAGRPEERNKKRPKTSDSSGREI